MSNSMPAAALSRLQPRALYEAIADRVRERILCHDLKPGEPINEVDLVNDYGVSRTPVREALKVLNHEGLLTLVNRRGMAVTALEPSERREALQLYLLLSRHAESEEVDLSDCGHPTLLRRLLQIVERQLRLAYGPSFEDEMRRLELRGASLSGTPPQGVGGRSG